MALNITTLLLVIAITFMHSIFGFFSGLINVFCSIVSLVVALGFYEALNRFITGQFGLHPGYSEPICLVLLFVVTTIVLRTLADNYIRGNVKVPTVVDWGGASVCGFINAQIFVGILVIGVQMLPLRNPETGTVIGFATYARNADERDPDHPEFARFDRNHLWTRSDEFAVGLFDLISSGSMRGQTTFASVYPDFTEAVFYSTNTVQAQSSPSAYRDEKEGGDGFEKGLRVEEWWEQTAEIDARYRQGVPTERVPTPDHSRKTFQVAPGKKLIGTMLVLNKSAADRSKRVFLHLFRPTMLRLVGRRGDTPQHYVARVIANADERIEGAPRIVDYDSNFSVSGEGNARIYAYFEVDQDFQPAFVEYRRHARAAMPSEPLEQVPALELTLGSGSEERESRPERGGGRTFGRVLEQDSGDNHRLPFAVARARLQGSSEATISDRQFVSGRIAGTRSRLAAADDEPRVDEFQLPRGYRLLQIRYKPREVRTVVGQVFNFVGQLNQYRAIDRNGNHYNLAGYYALVRRGRDERFELFFNGGPDNPVNAAYRNMLDFRDFRQNEINDQEDTIVGLLFLVPPNTEIRRIENQTGDGGDVRFQMRN